MTSKSISTQTENIGAGGICVIIKDDLGLFQGVDVELYLDETRPPIKSGGPIVWVVKKPDPKPKSAYSHVTGVGFIDIRPEDRDKISEIVEEILEKQRRK